MRAGSCARGSQQEAGVKMCGICGFAGFEDRQLLRRMAASLEHRGPDDAGFFTDSNISLGHRRLSIIDLSRKGRNPVRNEDGSIQLVYNGEVYNFRELRSGLERAGHRFYSSTDSEVIVHAYEQWGEKCLGRFNGMFAFALWDAGKGRLFLARDRAGIKPLYYAFHEGGLLFASEIKALLQHSEVPREPDRNAISQFLTFRVVPGSGTMFRGIMKLLPGHYMVYEKGRADIKKYWALEMAGGEGDEFSAVAELRGLFAESVGMRLVSDVPLGAFLSGGVDSSAIVAQMSLLMDEPVKTFTVGFGEEGDEFPHAAKVASALNTQHRELLVDYGQMLEAFPRLVWNMDEPVADPAIMPTFFVSKLARKHVTVALLGEGADELFAGYSRYRMAAGISGKMPGSAERYISQDIAFRWNEKRMLMGGSLVAQREKELVERYFRGRDALKKSFLDRALYFDFMEILPNYQLMRVDRLTMAHGLEARVPFLDFRIAEFSGRLGAGLKVRNGTGKYLVKKMGAKLLPKKDFFERKRIFSVPLRGWFDSGFREIAEKLLSGGNVRRRGYFNYAKVRRLFDEQRHGLVFRNRASNQIWMLAMLELWHQTFIDREKIKKFGLKLNEIEG